jgi:hypothetical protein
MQQSTLSRCIRQLEDSLGVTVFERSSGGYARRRPDETFFEGRDRYANKWMRSLRRRALRGIF